jgi:hypothetical protein
MAITPIFNAFRQTSEESGGQPSYMDALLKGFKGAQEAAETVNKPKKLAEELLSAKLKNAHDKTINQYLDRSENARIGNTEASTGLTKENTYAQQIRNQFLPESERQRIEASKRSGNPLSHLTGAANESYQLRILKQQLGENDPTVIQAQKQYDLEQESKRGLNSYRINLSNSLDKRSSSAVGKLQAERQAAIDANAPQQTIDQYDLAIQKNVTDADNRKKVLLATNIDKTIDQINPKDLTHFAGLGGEINLKKEELKAVKGDESKQYRDYLKAVSNSEIFAHQVRQFYGDSIQPAMLAKLERLTNPATWKNNPRIAKELYDSVVKTIKNETETYRSGLKGTSVYKGNENKNSNESTVVDYIRDASGRLVPSK